MKLNATATLIVLIALSACARTAKQGTSSIALISPDGSRLEFSIEIADEPEEYQRGLMFRESLGDGAGMFFVFEEERPLSFWMKNTLIPLDIIYFDAEGGFVSSATMQPCTSDSCDSYPSVEPAQYALEVNAGVVERHGIGTGWMLQR